MSIAAFVDATVDQIRAHMDTERDRLRGNEQAERREVVALLLQGAPITAKRAQDRLGYRLDREHYACVVWSDAAEPDLAALDTLTDLLSRPVDGTRGLTVVASTGTRWVWTTAEPQHGDAVRELTESSDLKLAVAGPDAGVDGFRRSHIDALATQRLLSRLGNSRRCASWDEVALASLAGQDLEAATRFIARTLGDLATADPELRDTLRLFIDHKCVIGAAADAAFTHRNTFQRRLHKAQKLLPTGTLDPVTQVGVALELVRWNSLNSA